MDWQGIQIVGAALGASGVAGVLSSWLTARVQNRTEERKAKAADSEASASIQRAVNDAMKLVMEGHASDRAEWSKAEEALLREVRLLRSVIHQLVAGVVRLEGALREQGLDVPERNFQLPAEILDFQLYQKPNTP